MCGGASDLPGRQQEARQSSSGCCGSPLMNVYHQLESAAVSSASGPHSSSERDGERQCMLEIHRVVAMCSVFFFRL